MIGNWIINLGKEEKEDEDAGPSSPDLWDNMPYIHKIPARMAGENTMLYRPQLVSLGPCYHHEYSDVELNKDLTAACFILSRRFFVEKEEFIHFLRRRLRKALQCPYDPPMFDKKFVGEPGAKEFAEMMFTDGCFILDVLRLGNNNELGKNDEYRYNAPIIKQDMLLLENQVPFWLLEYLLFTVDAEREKVFNYRPGDQTGKSEELLDLVIKFYSLPESTKKIGPPYLHILDIYRRGLISQDIHRDETKIKDYKQDETAQYFPSASKLYEASIPFEKSQTTNLKDISYHRGTLRLPPILITKDTVPTLANMMAFEKLHLGAGNEITSYVFVLKCLIHNARDVSLLESREVIQHALRDDEDVVKSFGLITNYVDYPPANMLDELHIVSQQLKLRRFRRRLNIWRLDLLEKYLNTPWGALSVFAAILLFTLTIIQTVYTVLSYVHPK